MSTENLAQTKDSNSEAVCTCIKYIPSLPELKTLLPIFSHKSQTCASWVRQAKLLKTNTRQGICIGTIPLIFKRIGFDPDLASGPILTTITDMLGFFLSLTFASLALNQIGNL